MDDAATPLIVSVVAFVLLGAVFGGVGVMLGSGRITRNNAIGIRTAATLSSDEAWKLGHQAGGRWVIASAVASGMATLIGVLVLVVTGLKPSELDTALVILGGFGVIIGLLVVAGVVADRAAQSVR